MASSPLFSDKSDIVTTSSINNDIDQKDFQYVTKDTININKQISNHNLYLASFVANIASVAAATTMSWTSPTLAKIEVPGEKILITKEQGAWLGSLLPLGACFGPILTGVTVGSLGKKWSIMANLLAILLAWIVIGFVTTIEPMYVARFITGAAVGSIFNIVPVYVSEISTPELRSPLGSFFVLMLSAGFSITYIVGPYVSVICLIIVSACIPIVGMLAIFWIPESPYDLLHKNRKQAAGKAVEWFRGHPDKSYIQLEVAEMQDSIDRSQQGENKSCGSLIRLMTASGNLKAIYYAFALMIFQQMSGINAVMFYSESIFRLTGSSISSSASTIVVGLVMFLASILLSQISKLIRMKHLMYLSTASCLLSIGILGVYFYLKENLDQDVSHLGWVPITCMIVYIMMHCIGLGAGPWVIVAELFSPRLKSLNSALTTSFCWFLCFIITKFFAYFVTTIGTAYTFWIFGFVCLVGLLFCIFQLPDTHGKTFQEIQDLLHSSNNKKSNI